MQGLNRTKSSWVNILSMCSMDSTVKVMQGLISPFKAVVELKSHRPKDLHERTSLNLDIKCTKFEAQPSFGQMPLFHSGMRMAMAAIQNGQLVSSLPSLPVGPTKRN